MLFPCIWLYLFDKDEREADQLVEEAADLYGFVEQICRDLYLHLLYKGRNNNAGV